MSDSVTVMSHDVLREVRRDDIGSSTYDGEMKCS